MNRRQFVSGSAGLASALALPTFARAAQSTPEAATDLPRLELTLTDTGFEIEQPIQAGRYAVTVTNAGTSPTSHFALGKIPDDVTDAQYEEWASSEEDSTDALSFEDIAFVGVPDWPQPGKSVTGVIDLDAGRYFLFDPISGREFQTVIVEGEPTEVAEPQSDLTVTLTEMSITLPKTAFSTKPLRWKIENIGGFSHEVAVVPAPPELTAEMFQAMLTMPEDATPTPDMPEFEYQPIAAIGILAGGHTSWLDVQLEPGHYLAACMLPFNTGYPHAMDGMYLFFDVA